MLLIPALEAEASISLWVKASLIYIEFQGSQSSTHTSMNSVYAWCLRQLSLELSIVMSAGNWTQVFCKTTKCSYPLSNLYTLAVLFFCFHIYHRPHISPFFKNSSYILKYKLFNLICLVSVMFCYPVCHWHRTATLLVLA